MLLDFRASVIESQQPQELASSGGSGCESARSLPQVHGTSGPRTSLWTDCAPHACGHREGTRGRAGVGREVRYCRRFTLTLLVSKIRLKTQNAHKACYNICWKL